MNTITSKRNPSGIHTVLKDGVAVGETWRRPGTRGFGLRLNGYYWSNGCPNRRGGLTTTTTTRMKDALDLADSTLRAA